MSNLPEMFVARGLELADGALFCGIRLSDMTRDELIAVAVHGWAAQRRMQEEFSPEASVALFIEKGKACP